MEYFLCVPTVSLIGLNRKGELPIEAEVCCPPECDGGELMQLGYLQGANYQQLVCSRHTTSRMTHVVNKSFAET